MDKTIPQSLRVPLSKQKAYQSINSKRIGDESWWSSLERILKEKKVMK